MLKPVYALVGTDLFLQLQRLRDVLSHAPKDIQRVDADGETAQLADVLDELRSFAMFSSAKAVIVRNADEFITRFREPLENYVSKPSSGSMLVLRCNSLPKNQRIYKLITAAGEVLECEAPKQTDIPRWIIEHGKTCYKLAIGPAEAQLLADLIGNDLGRLDNELAKLSLQCDGKLDTSMINSSISFQREQEMWDMTDEVAAGHVKAAVTRWRQLVHLDSSAEFRATTWLTMWLEKARKALILRRQKKSDYQIAKDLKIWPADKQAAFFRTATTLGEAGVSRLISLLAELDYRSKTGLGDMADNIEKFLLAVART